MRALERDVQDAVWHAIEGLLPDPPSHPLGCLRPRTDDRLVSRGIPMRLTTGPSWRDIESILHFQVSDTTVRTRRNEWIAAGVFDELCRKAIEAFDKIIGLDLTEFAIDGSQHTAPYGGEGTGPRAPLTGTNLATSGRPSRRADRLGTRWSEPQRRQTPRAHLGRERSARPTRERRHDPSRSRLRPQQHPSPYGRTRPP